MALDAISRALYRTNVSRRYLLQWTTAATVQAAVKTNLVELLRQHWKEPVSALMLDVDAMPLDFKNVPSAICCDLPYLGCLTDRDLVCQSIIFEI